MWQNCSLSGCDKVPLPLAVTALSQMLGLGGSALVEVPGSTLSPLMLLKGTWWPWWPLNCSDLVHRRHGFDPWVGKIPGGGHGIPLLYFCLENPMD